MYGYCEDYPCCGHTDLDPCPGRGSVAMTGEQAAEAYYCDDCGFSHVGACDDRYWDDDEYTCGRELVFGPRHDPYGATCDRPVDHDGPHEGNDALTEGGRIRWTGGGYAGGDPLPSHITEWIPAH